MKSGIHPRYEATTVKCACGSEFVTRSTKKELSVVLCNACHPFYTGKQKFVDTAGRIEKFQKRFNVAEGEAATVAPAKKQLSKRQIQAAAIQEEKRQKAARKARPADAAPTAGDAAPATPDAPAATE